MIFKLNPRRWSAPTQVATAVATATGCLLPIQVIRGVPTSLLSIAAYGGFAAIWICFPVRTDDERDALIARWLVPLGIIALVLGPVSALRQDNQMLVLALNLGTSIGAALVLGRRPDAVRPLLAGFTIAASLSATTAIFQAAGLPALAPDAIASNRHPGLAGSSLLASWHFAIAIVAAAFLAFSGRSTMGQRLLAAGSILVCLAGMGLSGSQGGILGLAMASVVLASHAWRPRNLSRLLLTIGAAALLLGASVALLATFEAPTFADIGGAGSISFNNEQARLEVARAAINSIIDNPLTGQSMESFRDDHLIAPHFFPLTIGVPLGLPGVLLACVPLLLLIRALIAGPRSTSASARWGCALLGLFAAYSMVEPVGPFVSISRLPLLLAAALACGAMSSFDGPGVTQTGQPVQDQKERHAPQPEPGQRSAGEVAGL